MRKIVFASAAILSALFFGLIAAATPMPEESTSPASGYGVFALQAHHRL